MSNQPRPCLAQHPETVPDKCRACWLFENDARYRKLWGGDTKLDDEPSLLRKAANLAEAAIRHALAGFPLSSEEQSLERLRICRSNECGQYQGNDSCRKCGCNLPAKARWAEQKCPEGRWPLTVLEVYSPDSNPSKSNEGS